MIGLPPKPAWGFAPDPTGALPRAPLGLGLACRLGRFGTVSTGDPHPQTPGKKLFEKSFLPIFKNFRVRLIKAHLPMARAARPRGLPAPLVLTKSKLERMIDRGESSLSPVPIILSQFRSAGAPEPMGPTHKAGKRCPGAVSQASRPRSGGGIPKGLRPLGQVQG